VRLSGSSASLLLVEGSALGAVGVLVALRRVISNRISDRFEEAIGYEVAHLLGTPRVERAVAEMVDRRLVDRRLVDRAVVTGPGD